ncbi:MAG TPA: hypothetical protein VNT79_06300 [Phycisphaerae bacterium]|nr:hypothetical protein [Phycisphaerae bacterium]
MAVHEQQFFNWDERPTRGTPAPTPDVPTDTAVAPQAPPELAQLKAPSFDDVPIASPLSAAIEHGVFGLTTEGAYAPNEEDVRAITVEQATELMATLVELQSVEDALRTGEDPRTGKVPRTDNARLKLREYLEREAPLLATAYGDVLAAFANGFGDEAARALDLWVRRTLADCTIEPRGRYDPGHPWHYYHEGDAAPPIAVDDIEPDLDAGRFIERDLPKNRAKRTARVGAMLAEERQRVEEDRRRYQEIVERGAEALSRYDREIAHSSDEMARATALSLKYNHLRWGMGRVAWLESQLGIRAGESFLSSDCGRDRNEP